ENDCLDRLRSNEYGKPSLDDNTFFNLSHSGKFVICAFHTQEVGIDIEEIKEIDLKDFKSIFTEEEKYKLKHSSNPLKDFYRYWTIKESVIKAEGKGLSIPLQLIDASGNGEVLYGDTTWYITEFSFLENYCCSLATKER